jgi:hypothetical protein
VSEPTYPKGYTISVYLPGGVTNEQVDKVMNHISEGVFGDLLAERGQWDPLIVGHKGDLLQVDHEGHDCCPPHVYFSTSCFHGNHDYCQSERGLIGIKTPAVCKFCEAPCVCRCHADREGDSVDEVNTAPSASEGESSYEGAA